MVIVTDKELLFKKPKNLLVTLLLINARVMGPKIMPMVTNTLENGYPIYLMAKVIFITIPMNNTLVHSKMVRDVDKVNLNEMEMFMRVTGLMGI